MKKFGKVIMSIAVVCMLMASAVLLLGCTGTKKSIKIYTSPKTEYYVGEELDLGDSKIVYTDEKGQEQHVVITKEMVSGFNNEEVGEKDMIITYEGCTALVKYNVSPVLEFETNVVYYFYTGSSYEYCMLTDTYNVRMASSEIRLTIHNAYVKLTGDSAVQYQDTYKNEVVKEDGVYKRVYYYAMGSGLPDILVKRLTSESFSLDSSDGSQPVMVFTKLKDVA